MSSPLGTLAPEDAPAESSFEIVVMGQESSCAVAAACATSVLRSSCGHGCVWKRPFTWGDLGSTPTSALGAVACQEEMGLGRAAPPSPWGSGR